MRVAELAEFEPWLRGERHAGRAAFAARCALRALPALDASESAQRAAETLAAARAVLSAAVWAVYEEEELAEAARDAYEAANRAAAGAGDEAQSAAIYPCGDAALACQEGWPGMAGRALEEGAVALERFGPAGGWEDVSQRYLDSARSDANAAATLSETRDWFDRPLWRDDPPQAVRDAVGALSRAPSPFDPLRPFWNRWLGGMMRGAPLAWPLQRDVALIAPEIWAEGQVAVDRAIALIEARWGAMGAAERVAEHLAQRPRGAAAMPAVAPPAVPMMGHNNPPPEAALPVGAADVAVLSDRMAAVEALMRAPSPPVAAVEAVAAEVEAVERRLGTWFAQKLDVAAEEFFKEIGKWSGRIAAAGLGVGALWAFGLLERLGPLVRYLWEVARWVAG